MHDVEQTIAGVRRLVAFDSMNWRSALMRCGGALAIAPSCESPMTEPADLRRDTAEWPDDAAYAWWLSTHPAGLVLAISAKEPPLLHRASCREVDRDRHPGRLKATGRRQICAETTAALRGWVARELPGASSVLARCHKCAP